MIVKVNVEGCFFFFLVVFKARFDEEAQSNIGEESMANWIEILLSIYRYAWIALRFKLFLLEFTIL